MWSNKSGTKALNKEDIQTPGKLWQWIEGWTIDYTVSGGTDEQGFQYAIDFPFQYHREKGFTDTARRRRWYRRCKINTTGPWRVLEDAPPLTSISLCSYTEPVEDGSSNTYVCAWAIAKNGDALCRIGVTSSSPAGTAWIHVPCNQKLNSISVGGQHGQIRVWATAVDGTACLRNGISRNKLEGISWFYVEPPRSKSKGSFCPLEQISVGKLSVFAIDKNKQLWIREKIVPTFPEGTEWVKVSDDVYKVSANCNDDYCAVSVRAKKRDKKSRVLAIRDKVSEENKIGCHWKLTGISAFTDVSFI